MIVQAQTGSSISGKRLRMRRRLFPAVVGLGMSFFVVAATVAVGGGRDGGGVVGDGDGSIALTWSGATWTVLLGSPRGKLAS